MGLAPEDALAGDLVRADVGSEEKHGVGVFLFSVFYSFSYLRAPACAQFFVLLGDFRYLYLLEIVSLIFLMKRVVPH